MKISRKNIDELDKVTRINLINSCNGYKSANLIGSQSKSGQENVAVFSSVTHMGSNPPLLGFFCRPTTVIRDTYNNIKETEVYTINHISESMIEDAHHTSASYQTSISEFDVTNLNPEYKEDCFAPFVKESKIKIEMKFVEEHHIPANDTILVVGEIINLYLNDNLLGKDGFINLSKAEVATISGLDSYSIPKFNKRLEFQRPKPIKII